MGIKDYHKWMKEQYPNAFKKSWCETYDHIYIDINCLLHYNSYGIKSQTELFNRLFATLNKLFQLTIPIKTITICADGVCPLAKTLLQRERRLTISRNEINPETSSLMFTPGTIFMNNLKNNLKKYFDEIEHIYNVTVSYQIECPGEAELKLKKQMDTNIQKYDITNTHIIFTNDADVIAMFGTFDICYLSRIFIMCNIKEHTILSIGKLLDLHTDSVGMTTMFGYDFMAISILLGNDYLPKVYCASLQKLWDVYKKIARYDVDGLIRKKDNNIYVDINFFVSLLNGIILKTNSIKPLNNVNYQLYDNYLDGFIWCLDMYIKGECIDYKYMYNYTDDAPPHPLGIMLTLYTKKSFILSQRINKPIEYKIYPIIVFPQSAYCLLDLQYKNIPKKIPELYEEEQCKKCKLLYDLKNSLNQTYKKDDSDEIKKKLLNARQNLTLHKQQHSSITCDDIDTIVIKVLPLITFL
jgi:hypothetical protein